MNPGSAEAQDAGCICPVVDNHFGRGYFADAERYGYIYNEDCPIHGTKKQEKPPTEKAEGEEVE